MNDCSSQQVLRQNLSWFLSEHLKMLFLRGFILKEALRLRDQHVFLWQSVETLNIFNTLALKQIFWKTKTFFKKLEYRFLVESTEIKNASFPHKTVISEANVLTNTMVSTEWTYHIKRSFASNYFIFLKILFQFENFL